MESGSSGSYSDYSSGENGRGDGGTSSNCPESIIFELEDIGRCPYFKSNQDVPKSGAYVRLRNSLYNNRLAIEDNNSTVMGLVPVEHNYLHECIKAQISYHGSVIDSSNSKPPFIEVEVSIT